MAQARVATVEVEEWSDAGCILVVEPPGVVDGADTK